MQVCKPASYLGTDAPTEIKILHSEYSTGFHHQLRKKLRLNATAASVRKPSPAFAWPSCL